MKVEKYLSCTVTERGECGKERGDRWKSGSGMVSGRLWPTAVGARILRCGCHGTDSSSSCVMYVAEGERERETG